ncbi:hypothetical protein cypCar_00023910, partial [Cyprinus carpio]
EKEEVVLGSLPLLSFKIGPVQASDNISRKFAFKVGDLCAFVLTVLNAVGTRDGRGGSLQGSKLVFGLQAQDILRFHIVESGFALLQVWCESNEEEEEEEEESEDLKGSIAFCLQAEHTGTRTYYFSADSQKEQEEWIQAMSEAARVHIPATSRNKSDPVPTADENDMVAKRLQPNSHAENGQRPDVHEPVKHELNGVETRDTTPSTPVTPVTPNIEGRMGEKGVLPPHHPNGWGSYGPPNGSRYQSQENVRDMREPHEENVVMRRGFVPRTAPERLAQRKSSMTQLQQWVNQRRAMVPQDDGRRYYTVNRAMSADYYGVYNGPPYVDDYPLYPPGVRPESICSMSAAYNRPPPRWTMEERRRSLRDGPLYGQPQDPQWMMGPQGPAYYPQLDSAQNSMRRLSIQPRSRSVPRSPSSSLGGPYSPHSFASPARSPSVRFDRGPGRLREEGIYADPSVYGLRRSLSSPKYDFPGDRRSYSQGMYHYNYPASPSLHSKMVPPFHDVYGDLHPTLKLNEIETSKLLGRLCEQNRLVKEQEAVVHRLRMEKDSLEGVLVATHQEMELYRSQPLAMEKLQLKKESLQNKLINIRGELSQASSALTTTRMEFEALEDEVNSIHGDLWEQLNAGGQSELVHRHIQNEFWRVQDVLEGLHKNNPSRGTDTAKHRVASGASGSFSTNSPASPLSSVSLTSPLSPFSPVPGSQASPTKQLATEEVGPPRPPLPKSYQPLESSQSFPPSVPPLPLDSYAWLRSMGPHSGIHQEGYKDDEEFRSRKHNYNSQGEKINDFDTESNQNKVGIVPPRTKNNSDGIQRRNGKVSNGHISRERPKSAVFTAEVKSKMSVEEQNERIRRNQSSSVRDKRRSLNLSSNQNIDGKSSTNYRVVRRRVTADEVDIKDLEAAVRGEGVESPRQEIARLRRQVEPEHYDLDLNKELSKPDKVLIPERYLDIEPSTPLSPEELQEKQKKVERIKTLIAKSNLQNVVPVLDGPVEGTNNPDQQLHEQEKRIEISCALAAEASRRSRLLSGEEACRPEEPGRAVTPTV